MFRSRRASGRDLADGAPLPPMSRGRLTALHHHALSTTSSFDDFLEPAANASLPLYAASAIRVEHTGLRLDVGHPGSDARARRSVRIGGPRGRQSTRRRTPAAWTPLVFRLANYAETEPGTGPAVLSSKSLRECYAEGAKRFGWAGRPLQPRQRRDESGLLVGWGHGYCGVPLSAIPGRSGGATLRGRWNGPWSKPQEPTMGQGAWTALAQIAAEALGLDPSQVELHSGLSSLPDGGIAGGSAHTASAGLAPAQCRRERTRQADGPCHCRHRFTALRRRQHRHHPARRPTASPR